MTVKNEKISEALKNLMRSKTIAFQSAYALIAGGAINGLFLAQAIYCETRYEQEKTRLTNKEGEVNEYFYHSHNQWFQDLGVSRREINSARAALKEKGFLQEVRAQIPARLFYRVDIDKVVESLSELKDTDGYSGDEEVSNQGSPFRAPKSVQNGLPREPETVDQESPKRSIIYRGPQREDKENGECDANASQVACATNLLPANPPEQTTAIAETEMAAVDTKSGKGRKGKKADKPKAEPDPRSSHAAIKKYQEILGKFPKKDDYDSIINMVGNQLDTWEAALNNLKAKYKKAEGKFYLYHFPYAEEAFQSLAILNEVPDFDAPNDNIWDVMDALNNDPKLIRKAS
jgi:hypothetical protein